MIASYVPAFVSPYTFDLAAEAMQAALQNELGAPPSRACLALALAKCALETGRFRSIWNHNWGNIKAGEQYVGQYCCFELNEVLAGQVVWFSPLGRLDRKGGKVIAEACEAPPGHPQTRMRANINRYDGAMRYVDFMVRGSSGRFAPAFERMKAGDAVGTVHLMKVAGYFTAPEGPYASGVSSLQHEFDTRLAGQQPASIFDPPDAEWERLRRLISGAWSNPVDAFVAREAERLLEQGAHAGRDVIDFERGES